MVSTSRILPLSLHASFSDCLFIPQKKEKDIPDRLRGSVGSTPRQACARAIMDSKEMEEEEAEGEEIRDLLRGPAGSAVRLACTIAIQLRMCHKTLFACHRLLKVKVAVGVCFSPWISLPGRACQVFACYRLLKVKVAVGVSFSPWI